MRRSMMIVCTWCFLTLALATAAEVGYEKAVAEAVKTGQAAEVNRLCTKWAAAEPGNEKPRIILGRTLLKAGLVDRAVEQFELAAEANPLSPAPRCEMGLLFLEEKKLDLAAKEFAEALRIDPRHLPAQVGKVRLELSRGQTDAALAAARTALDGHPESAEARALLADCLVARGDIDTALVEAATAAKAAPGNADVCYSYAAALELAGRAVDAQQAWQRFVEMAPQDRRTEQVRDGCVVLKTEILSLPPVGVSGQNPAVSPDGKHIAFGVFGNGLFRARLGGQGEPILIASCPEGRSQRYFTWSPDGASLAYQEYTSATPRKHRILRVAAEPGDGPTPLEFPGQEHPTMPAWSPDGEEVLLCDVALSMMCTLKVATGQHHKFQLVNKAGRGLYTAHGDFMPNGTEVVAVGSAKVEGELREALYRAAVDTGQISAKLFDYGRSRFLYPLVSEDGTTVAGIFLDKPSCLAVASTSPPSRPIRLCETGYGLEPSWHPEGRKIAASPMVNGVRKLAMVWLGGLDRRPLRIAAERKGGSLSAILTSQTEAPQQVSLRWEAFDDQSLRIGLGEAEDGPLDVKPREKAEWTVELDPTIAEKTQTVKITAIGQDGRGAVKLVDWQE